MNKDLDILTQRLCVISNEAAEKISSMVEVFTEPDVVDKEQDNPAELLSSLLGGGSSSCKEDTQKLIDILKILGCNLQHLKTIMIDVMGMPETDFGYNYPLLIESSVDGDDVVYKLTTSPLELSPVALFIKYKYGIPFVVNTTTGVSYSCVITPEVSAENSKNINEIISCLIFLSNNVTEICSMLLKHA